MRYEVQNQSDCAVCIFSSSSALAGSGKWQLGVTGGFAVANAWNLDLFGMRNLQDDWSVYNGGDLMLSAAYQLSPRTKIRVNLGVERIFNEQDYSGMFGNHFTLVAEAAMLFHFVKEPKAFDPYLVTGVGFPTFPHVGVGNSFRINDNTAMFVEVLGSSAILHNRVDTRVGVMFRF